jgi:hypothetical protein
MNRWILAATLCLVTAPAWAQDAQFKIPPVAQRKPWYRSGQFWAGQLAAGAPLAVDYYSTSLVFHRCPGCTEGQNIFLGSRPSDRKIALFALGEWAAWGGLHVLCHTKAYRPRLCSLLTVAATSAIHIQPVVHNFHLLGRLP